jgi:hypothetical protein
VYAVEGATRCPWQEFSRKFALPISHYGWHAFERWHRLLAGGWYEFERWHRLLAEGRRQWICRQQTVSN